MTAPAEALLASAPAVDPRGWSHDARPSSWPDLGEASMGCCWGTTIYGPHRCTCWEPVYDVDQAEPDVDAQCGIGPVGGCHDCAYRADSPERAGDELVRNDEDDLHYLVAKGIPFWCHQGMRRPIKYVHPSGAEYVPPGIEHAFGPPEVNGRPYKADGSPGDLCGGWAQRRLAWLERQSA